MSLEIFWFLPTSGDTRYLGKSNSGRPVTIEYMQQIAVTADNLGYDGIPRPTEARRQAFCRHLKIKRLTNSIFNCKNKS